MTSIDRLQKRLVPDTKKCLEVRRVFDSFEAGKQFDRQHDPQIIIVSELYRGETEITIIGHLEHGVTSKQIIAPNSSVVDTKVSTSEGGKNNVQITIKKGANEVFAVRPALVLADVSQSLGTSDSGPPQEYWRPFDPETRPSDSDQLRRMINRGKEGGLP